MRKILLVVTPPNDKREDIKARFDYAFSKLAQYETEIDMEFLGKDKEGNYLHQLSCEEKGE